MSDFKHPSLPIVVRQNALRWYYTSLIVFLLWKVTKPA